MSNGSAMECAGDCRTPLAVDGRSPERLSFVKSIPWLRVLIDVLLVGGLLLASSSLFSVR